MTTQETLILKYFTPKVTTLCPNYTPMVIESKETLLDVAKDLIVKTTTLEGNGVKYELHVLSRFTFDVLNEENNNEENLDFVCLKNSKDISSQLPNNIERVIEITTQQGFK